MFNQKLKSQMDFLSYNGQKYGQYLGYVLLMLVVLIVFQSAQQYFSIVRYDLAPNRQDFFGELLIGQFYRWVLWLLISLVYFLRFSKETGLSEQDNSTRQLMISPRIVMHVIGLILLNIVAITIFEALIADGPVTLAVLKERLVFYFFQKTPIYTLAYIAMLALYHLINLKDNLQVEIVSLKNVNEQQQAVIEKTDMQKSNEDLTMLSIKVGSSYKMIAVEDICWLEAYDYCVKIHTHDAQVFAMRNSLKALEKQLSPKHFLRIHRKAIVNMQKAQGVTFSPQAKVILSDELTLEIAQSRIKAVKAYLVPIPKR
jgi:DNA-binding LytR/AlgR family response regulator